MNFHFSLINKLVDSYLNNHTENYDSFRFGKEKSLENSISGNNPELEILNSKGYYRKDQIKDLLVNVFNQLNVYLEDLERTYEILEDINSKETFIELLSFRLLGYKKVKLYTNNLELSKLQNEVYSYIDLENSKNSNFKDYKLYLFKFIYNKHSIRIFMTKRGPLNSFFLGQYRFNEHVGPEDGDYIIDCGACWGDSTLEFASRVGDRGKIFAYEFIPKSKQILKKNIELNPSLAERIELIDNAVWNESGIDAYYKDNGPGSRVEMQIFNEYEGKTKTLSIDDLVKTRKVPRLDWIKMDIEGAEPYALEGSIYTIKRFRPNLAISIYHNMDDFSQITPWLEELGVGYKFYIKHFTIHSEETVLFAIVN